MFRAAVFLVSAGFWLVACAPQKPIPLRHYSVRFEIPEAGFADLDIVKDGRTVKTLFEKRALSKGTFVFSWDGRDEKGKTVLTGEVLFRLKIESFRLEAQGAFGGMGAAPGRFLSPGGLAVHPQGARLVLAVADTDNNRVQLLTDRGSVLQVMGNFGSSESRLSRPRDVAWDGEILTVADTGNRRLAFFDARGVWAGEIRRLKGLSTGVFDFIRFDFQDPVRLIQEGPGVFWVLDRGFNRLVNVTAQGGVLRTLEGLGFVEDVFCLWPNGEFWVSVSAGKFLRLKRSADRVASGKKEALEGVIKGLGGLTAAQGFALGTETETRRLLLWDASGRLGGDFSLSQMSAPGALTVWPQEAALQVFIVDRAAHRIQRYFLKKQTKLLEYEQSLEAVGGGRAGF